MLTSEQEAYDSLFPWRNGYGVASEGFAGVVVDDEYHLLETALAKYSFVKIICKVDYRDPNLTDVYRIFDYKRSSGLDLASLKEYSGTDGPNFSDMGLIGMRNAETIQSQINAQANEDSIHGVPVIKVLGWMTGNMCDEVFSRRDFLVC